MQRETIILGYADITIAAIFVIMAGIISVMQNLKLGKPLLIASLRTVVQLSLAGLALGFVFKLDSPVTVLLLAVVMALMAGREAIRRQKYKVRGIGGDTLLSLFVSSFLIAIIVSAAVVKASPWWTPPIFIPLIGMILGNSLNGISIGLDRFLSSCESERSRIEARLLLGASPKEASLPYVQDAIRAGMMPIINAMSIVGIVSLPGIMTGQLLAGASPANAVKYQIVVMYMLAASNAIGSMLAVLMARKRVFTQYATLKRLGK